MSLTNCKTIEYVYVYPEIIEPVIDPAPVRAPYDVGFSQLDDIYQKISESDARILGAYILDLKLWGAEGWEWVKYYIENLKE